MAVQGLKGRRKAAVPKIETQAPSTERSARRLTAVTREAGELEVVTAPKNELEGASASIAIPKPTPSLFAGDWLARPPPSLRELYEQAKATLQPAGASVELVGPPPGTQVMAPGTSSLIGLPDRFFDPRASYETNLALLKAIGVPRFPLLTAEERAHETAFADDVQRDPASYVAGAELLSANETHHTAIFEVDSMKRMYEPYGVGDRPAGKEERRLRLTMNHPLHPTAVAVGQLAFLKKLDDLAKLPPLDPRRQIFVTNGGVAAGKGSLNDILKMKEGDVPFGATWDTAGEGDSRENAWILEACEARGLTVLFGYAAADANQRYEDVLRRQSDSGRVADLMTFTSSFTEGREHMKAFLDSPEYQAAAQRGIASAYVVNVGEWDGQRRIYRDTVLLGAGSEVKSSLIPELPPKAEIFASALRWLEGWAANQHAHRHPTADVVKGALGVDEKFMRAGAWV